MSFPPVCQNVFLPSRINYLRKIGSCKSTRIKHCQNHFIFVNIEPSKCNGRVISIPAFYTAGSEFDRGQAILTEFFWCFFHSPSRQMVG
jgi:hypothetical protein